MAGLGAKLFTAFSKLTAAQVNGYLMDQSIMRFATSVARDAAFGGAGEPTLAEGMHCYLDDTNVLQSYTGSAWVSVASSSGAVLQVVFASTTTSLNSSTSTFATTGLTATITPKFTTSKILAIVSQNGLLKQNVTGVSLRLVRGSTVISDFAIEHNKTNTSLLLVTSASVSYLDSPATTSATTYKTEYASATNIADVYVQFASAMSTITLMEISA